MHMILKNLQDIRKISVLFFSVLLISTPSVHSFTHLHTEFEVAAGDHCDGFDYIETGLHLHDAATHHDDCGEMHCNFTSCLPPAKINTGTSVMDHMPVPVRLFSLIVPTDGQCTVVQYRQPALLSSFTTVVLRI